MRLGTRFCTILTGLVVAVPGMARADDIDRLVFAAGAYDVLHEDTAAAFQLEWRPGVRYFGFVAPFVGGFVTTEGSTYGYLGFGFDLPIGDRFAVMPFTSAGLYGRGDGVDLGHVVEFRTGVEVSYRFDNGGKLALSGAHLSNAGLGSQNPGTELLMLHYAIPLGSLFP